MALRLSENDSIIAPGFFPGIANSEGEFLGDDRRTKVDDITGQVVLPERSVDCGAKTIEVWLFSDQIDKAANILHRAIDDAARPFATVTFSPHLKHTRAAS